MGEDMADIHLAALEMYRGDKPIFVAANVEHNPIVYFVRRWKSGTQLTEVEKFRVSHNLEPTGQWGLTVGILLPELAQGFARDDVHKPIISQNEI
jgi:hypothetical protein